MPNYFSIQIKNVTKGKTDAEKKKLKRNKKQNKNKKANSGYISMAPEHGAPTQEKG